MREERTMAEQAVPTDLPGRPEVPAAREVPSPAAREAASPAAREAASPAAREVPSPAARAVPSPAARAAPSPAARAAASPAAGPRAVTAAGSVVGSPAGPGAGSPVSTGSTASIGDIIARQEEMFAARQPESRRLAGRAGRVLAGGVTSSWQTTRPQPVWLSHGKGSKIYDVDGNEYVDLHGGYGAALAGHGHPAIVEAIRGQAVLGTHFAQPTPAAILVAEELTRRFGLPLWRFANSGTEATMDAVHLMRAITGRDLIIKVEGCYHGHHDSVQVSVCPEAGEVGPPHKPAQVPASTGIPQAIMDLTLVVGFNDLEGVARLLDEHQGRIAGMIIEPIMMNAGIILPEPGYLAGLKDLLHSRDVLLTFDE